MIFMGHYDDAILELVRKNKGHPMRTREIVRQVYDKENLGGNTILGNLKSLERYGMVRRTKTTTREHWWEIADE